MLKINEDSIEGQIYFISKDPATEWICIGYGQNPQNGVNYFVGMRFDSVNNRTTIETHRFTDGITFKGKL